MKITLERSGGFAGILRKYALDLWQLEPAERERLRGAIAAAGFFDLPETIVSSSMGVDHFHYVLVIRAGFRKHRVQTSEPDIPPVLRDLIEEIIRLV